MTVTSPFTSHLRLDPRARARQFEESLIHHRIKSAAKPGCMAKEQRLLQASLPFLHTHSIVLGFGRLVATRGQPGLRVPGSGFALA